MASYFLGSWNFDANGFHGRVVIRRRHDPSRIGTFYANSSDTGVPIAGKWSKADHGRALNLIVMGISYKLYIHQHDLSLISGVAKTDVLRGVTLSKADLPAKRPLKVFSRDNMKGIWNLIVNG